MSNSNYQRGANFERRVKKHYENQGYFVLRSAGSHSPVDLLALGTSGAILIQVKLDGRMSITEEQQLIRLAQECQCKAHLVSKEGKEIIIKEVQ